MDREELRRRKIAQCEEKTQEIYTRLPRLREIEEEIKQLSFKKIQHALLKKGSFSKELDDKVYQLIKEKDYILEAEGFSPDVFEPDWDCKKCNDRGYIEPGITCSCFSREKTNILLEKSGLVGEMLEKTFDNFNLNYYTDSHSMQRKIQRSMEFIDNIHRGEKQKNLYLFGEVGTGKTHLSLAIANALLKYNHSVIYKRIDDLLEIIIDFKYENKENKEQLEILKNSDLLVIDDLGAEKTSPFALNQIRIILEERANMNKSMIINSNLDLNNLQKYYGQRIADRIIENFDIYELKTEESIRVQKKREGF